MNIQKQKKHYLQDRLTIALVAIMLLLPNIVMASEPTGPSGDDVAMFLMMFIGMITSLVSLILLFTKSKKAFNVFLVINIVIYASFYIELYSTLASHYRKLSVCLELLFIPGDDGIGYIITWTTIVFWAIMIIAVLRRRNKRRSTSS